ncbi:MAG: NUDIX hydrolase [Clostridiales bacterium]|uniref:NUDIX hydrolase n=1 Tax=Hornefia butyriciproducens TaxID=2652293 RepID=UPI002A912CAC|nr:NUDIX hydrolase [Hornefia butyriciproducens]MCI7678810.1 NUDIX hydrolase [Clostridiales bacterium]MDY5423555.1 NUDIX hydrolase [Hornefia butyriciproducens]MDY5463068.1 NUDIX hydrolase [Hornefia butyriciproducens]
MWVGGVRVLIVNENNELLMLRQHHEDKDIWMVPGGAIEDGENSIQAAVREVKEETHLDVRITGVAWHVEEVSPQRGQRFVNYMIGEIIGGELELGWDPELPETRQILREVRFMSREEIGTLEHLYPRFLNDEVWDVLKEDVDGRAYYKLREPYDPKGYMKDKKGREV